MFTGIIEEQGEVVELKKEKDNLHITVKSNLSSELKVDQSLSHDGVCLTVVALGPGTHTITAIDETLEKSNLGRLRVGSHVNLERATRIGSRLDGHIVQGHVDQVGICTRVEELEGSWMFTFEYDPAYDNITIEKGSITVNGVSLTVVNSKEKSFSVAIIPYTFENTNFHEIRVNDTVNLEFDVIGKYVARLLSKEEA
jgi:riboflavin synthase